MFTTHRLALCSSLFVLCLVSATFAHAEPPRVLDRDDLRLNASAKFAQAIYRVADAQDDGVLQIGGDNLVIDFQGATLDGSAPDASPDAFRGRGIVIENARDVTIRNLTVKGFKIGIYARDCQRLIIENCDVSDNWKPRLLSTPEAENGADWLFGHENDQAEWLRYGAGIYLDNCREFTLRSNRGQRGQNGICLTGCRKGQVYDNDMSFNSGWGLALYRSSENEVAHNKFDWCIRGYSHGVYNRGQDSAGILVFEQCSDNIFAYNSATHGGDGFFLFAGLETLDESGQGGCNRNLVFRNDFSHASNNGIEATFSEGNRFIENVMTEADHAVWAGFSYRNEFIGNQIRDCRHGISIEHGSENRIKDNRFERNGVAINLWAAERTGFQEKPYGKHHHCRSQQYEILRNRFEDNDADIRLARTRQVSLKGNDSQGAKVWLEATANSQIEADGNNVSGEVRAAPDSPVTWKNNYFSAAAPPGAKSAAAQLDVPPAAEIEPALPEVRGEQDAMLPAGVLRGLKYIFVDDWGPYDFRRPKISPEQLVFSGRAELRVLGPDTPFKVRDVIGNLKVTPTEGRLPAVLQVVADEPGTRAVSLTVDLPELKQTLTARGLLLAADWQVKFYAWPDAGAQQGPKAWDQVLQGKPLEERRVKQIDFAWGGGAPSEHVPAEHFATVCVAELDLPAGRYLVRTVSDDGIRVRIDGDLAIDRWNWHPPTEDSAVLELAAGKHTVKIEHFEIDGVAQLQFWLRPVEQPAVTQPE